VFGGIVAELIEREYPNLKHDGFLHVKNELKDDVERGIYYWPA
jgi:hypothetical protein